MPHPRRQSAMIEPATPDLPEKAAPNGSGAGVQRLVLSCDVTIYLGDCLELLSEIAADAVISDPPYGMNCNTDSRRFSGGETPAKRGRGKDWARIAGDDKPFDPRPWLAWKKVVMFGSNHFGGLLPVGTTLVWIKRNDDAFGSFLSDAEVAWMKGGHGVYCKRDLSMNGRGLNFSNLHPTQKPVTVMAWCMDRAKVAEGETVVDPYMGSASTGIACIRTGRRFIGIEKDPKHFETARQRLEAELAQGDLFLRQNRGIDTQPQ